MFRDKKKSRLNLIDLFVLNQRWTKRFFASHLFGWVTASVQTIWIVLEIRGATIKILKALVGEKKNG